MGPGEFTQLGWVCQMPGDTLLAVDWSERRTSLWDGNGKLVRAYRRQGFLQEDACFPHGSLVLPAPVTTTRDDVVRASGSADASEVVEYRRIDASGKVLGSLGKHRRSQMARTQAGSIVSYLVSITAGKGGFYVADARKFELRRFSWDGRLSMIIRVHQRRTEPPKSGPSPTPRRGLSPDVRVTARRAAGPPQAGAALTEPAFMKVRSDEVDRVWVQDYRNPTQWTVFDSTGLLQGRLDLAAQFGRDATLAGTKECIVLIRTPDADGFVHLRLHRLQFHRATTLRAAFQSGQCEG